MTDFKILNDREHIRLRPDMYIGSIEKTNTSIWTLENNKFVQKEVFYSPGLIKIIDEILDNAVDECLKSKATTIKVNIDSSEVSIFDSGRGIPIEKIEGQYIPHIAWSTARSGTNFGPSSKVIGKNGVGSFLTNVYSVNFKGITVNNDKEYSIEFQDTKVIKETVKKSTKKPCTQVTFVPDLKTFQLDTIDETHKNIVYFRLLNLSILFPSINFYFNGNKIKYSFIDYLSKFSIKDELEYVQSDDDNNILIGITLNNEDKTSIFSYINGLNIKYGTHIDYVLNYITEAIKNKYKKYNLKSNDIKNKLGIIFLGINFENIKNDSQLKIDIKNSDKEIKKYLKNTDLDKLTKKIIKNDKIIDNIIEYYKIKEEFQKQQDLKKLAKPIKHFIDPKYLPSQNKNKYLMVCEGDSAKNSLANLLGNKETGYYQIQGVPLNCLEKDIKDNKELSNLYKIVSNEDYENIVIAADADLDGFHISFLLLVFFNRYFNKIVNENRLHYLKTPIAILYENNKSRKILEVFYDFKDIKSNTKNYLKYFKGLGSWDNEELTEDLIKIEPFEVDDETLLEFWAKKEFTDNRKEKILTYTKFTADMI